jgi:hypothetical protein
MSVPALQGLVRRRILINFRMDPQVAQRQLPPPFRPKLIGGWAMAGVCLIRLEQLRPRGLPSALGVSSENAAHRITVTWTDPTGGEPREGVYIPRRDTGALLNHLAGGWLFPGQHRRARFHVRDEPAAIDLRLETDDGAADVWLRARPGCGLPGTSCFASLDQASRFFAAGSVGFSATDGSGRLDGLRLRTLTWRVHNLDVEWVMSSYYQDRARFPAGSVEYDCTLLMRNIPHEWWPQPPPCA